MQPQTFYRAVAEDFSAVDEIIKQQLTSRVPLVSKIGDYITSAGGKRLRPLVVLLTSWSCATSPSGLMMNSLVEAIRSPRDPLYAAWKGATHELGPAFRSGGL